MTAARAVPALAAALVAVSVLAGCATTAPPETTALPETTAPPEATAPPSPAAAPPAPGCAGGAVYDDGTVETGYGFVPSAKFGAYVQALDARDLPAGKVETVCVCWLRTRADADVDFEVVFHRDAGGRPEPEPYARVAGRAEDVPEGVDAAGRLYEVDAGGIELPPGRSWIGVRWDPSADPFFFVCTDTSETTERVPVFSIEDRAPRWASVLESSDPIFLPHRAILVRAR